jgi:hypothetical protein
MTEQTDEPVPDRYRPDMHLTEQEMMEQAYGEGSNRAAVEQHLRHCRGCAGQFAELERDLAGVDKMTAPARDAGYGQRVWASIAGSLPAYAPERRGWAASWHAGWWLKGLSYAAACALLASSGFYAGRLWEIKNHPQSPMLSTAQAAAGAATQPVAKPQQRQPIVVVVLNDHLDRSERFLVQLKHADMDSAAMVSPMGDEARSLLAANKVCRKNLASQQETKRSGSEEQDRDQDRELTTALDHLDRLLGDEPGGLNAAAIARLQREMNADGLLFEVRVLRSRMAHRAAGSNGTSPANGATI